MNKENLVILVDTREIRNNTLLCGLSDKNIKFKQKKLNFGDYSFIYNDKNYQNECVVERKGSLTELSGNFCAGRCRFQNEFIRATEAGAKVTLLIEEPKGKEKMILRQQLDMDKSLTAEQRQKGTWRSCFTANSMIASIKSWKAKYNFDLIFCDKKDSADRILEVFTSYITNKGDI